jgi:mannose-6-phosphate isomerase-like protein (cupin superfamily)
MIEKIINKNQILAIILRANYKSEGIEFFTPNNFSQQLGYMNRPKGHQIKPHLHNNIIRTVEYTNEVLFIKSGKVKVNFYDENKVFLKSETLEKGDFILLAKGGHGFEMLETSEMIEIKQGPYAGDSDKTRF